MKIIIFWGGLGNQLFEYTYYQWLKSKYPNEKFYAYYPTIALAAHNGFEINQRFDVELPMETKFTTLIANLLFNANRICRKLHLPILLTCNQVNQNYGRLFHCDYWQDKKYSFVDLNLNFKNGIINIKNIDFIGSLANKNTVAVHIRRGDYLDPLNASMYGGICTEEYYKKALKVIENEVKNPYYVFFTDDMEYVRKNFTFPNMTIVDWNRDADSFQDMYLMSKCKWMILANSTFSYWAARLNKNTIKILCPNRWNNLDNADIILDSWHKID